MEQTPYGLWNSDLTPESMAGDLTLRDVGWSGDGETLVWLEERDGEGVLVARPRGDAQRDLTRELEVRGGVGYGGGAFDVHGETVYFAAADGRLYRLDLSGGRPAPITPAYGKVASPTVSPGGEWVVFVHTDGDDDVLAAVDVEGRLWPLKVASGADFYMQPSWHPDGDRLAWIEWDHPNMPWDETQLTTAVVEATEGTLEVETNSETARSDVSYLQPEYGPDGERLTYVSDRDGWWHLYSRDLETRESTQLTEGAFEVGGPAWVQGMRFYDWGPSGEHLLARRNRDGRMDLLRVGLSGEETTAVEGLEDYTAFEQPILSEEGELALIASSSRTPSRVVTSSEGDARIERRSSTERVSREALSKMKPVTWTVESDGREVEVHGNYYPPTNPDHESSGAPPAILMIHGGPTSQRVATFEERNQYFATRGFAVLGVNYRGSTGYGRDYRESLYGEWGVADVEDAVAGADFLVDQGWADPDRLVIMGGSAGGYTVLQSLVHHPGTFAGGICMYGVSNLFSLSMDTHKFEQHYTDQLIGPLPEASDAYRARSPIFHADQIEDPIAIFQGAEDQVVPEEQSESIVESLRARGVPHEYHVYDDEGHGWRHPSTIEHFYESTMDFLKQYVVFR
jgi:dipeptidyl aminopeptidase/acylaminoacyl peptidase